MKRAGKDGHKEINRTNLSGEDVRRGLEKQVVQDQLILLRMRNTYGVFSPDADISAQAQGQGLSLTWDTPEQRAVCAGTWIPAPFPLRFWKRPRIRSCSGSGRSKEQAEKGAFRENTVAGNENTAVSLLAFLK